MQLEVWVVSLVEGGHEGGRLAGVAHAEGVAELVGRHDLQVRAWKCNQQWVSLEITMNWSKLSATWKMI